MELIVYQDEDYPTCFSREVSRKITTFLKSKGFLEYSAEALAEWMEKSIDEKTCHQSLVLFSQDVVPETICHDKNPSSLIRTYLDCGGTIVWIGEIPCFYQGLKPSRASILRIDVDGGKTNVQSKVWKDEEGKYGRGWSRHGSFGVLGVLPVYFDFPVSPVTITKAGQSVGLKNPWYGHRPIVIKGSNIQKNKPVPLATSKPHYLMPTEKAIFYLEKEKKIPFQNLLEYASKLSGLIPSVILAMTAAISLLTGSAQIITLSLVFTAVLFMTTYLVYWFLFLKQKFANAWFINFDPQHPASGFIRLWDFFPNRISNLMLEDLHRVVLARVGMDKSAQKSG